MAALLRSAASGSAGGISESLHLISRVIPIIQNAMEYLDQDRKINFTGAYTIGRTTFVNGFPLRASGLCNEKGLPHGAWTCTRFPFKWDRYLMTFENGVLHGPASLVERKKALGFLNFKNGRMDGITKYYKLNNIPGKIEPDYSTLLLSRYRNGRCIYETFVDYNANYEYTYPYNEKNEIDGEVIYNLKTLGVYESGQFKSGYLVGEYTAVDAGDNKKKYYSIIKKKDDYILYDYVNKRVVKRFKSTGEFDQIRTVLYENQVYLPPLGLSSKLIDMFKK